jgi:hypothetical protein
MTPNIALQGSRSSGAALAVAAPLSVGVAPVPPSYVLAIPCTPPNLSATTLTARATPAP